MSKIIRMTPEYMDECRRELEKCLREAKLADGKISFTRTFSPGKRRATVYFTVEALIKMTLLIQAFDQEVAWHGVATRLDGEEDGYLVSDILVYPQTVGAATVEMDTEQYARWLMEHDGDERFQRIRMQGHSHVRMGVSPSSVDLNHQEEILAQLGDDDFYIFMICNKSFQRDVRIYDMRKNVLFENADVEVRLQGSKESFDAFLADAKTMVVSRSRVYTSAPPARAPGTVSAYNSPPPSPAPVRERQKARIGAGWQGADAAGPFGGGPYESYWG